MHHVVRFGVEQTIIRGLSRTKQEEAIVDICMSTVTMTQCCRVNEPDIVSNNRLRSDAGLDRTLQYVIGLGVAFVHPPDRIREGCCARTGSGFCYSLGTAELPWNL